MPEIKRVEKTVFLSYRRTNLPWALAIFQNLTNHGFDVFFDFNGIAGGDFESIILENLRARAHFIVLLTPSALERCAEPGDWLRREIEAALDTSRNIVPLMLEGFDFSSPGIASQLIGSLAPLKKYNALRVPAEYFDEAMERLCNKFLNVPLDTVIHPASATAARMSRVEQAAASAAPRVKERELTAQEWFEKGLNSTDPDEQIRCYGEAIRLKPDFASAFNNRGLARCGNGDPDGALEDYDQAIRLEPGYAGAFYNRGLACEDKGDLDGALQDYDQAIRLKPDFAIAFHNRGRARYVKGDLDEALQDFGQAIRLNPDYADPFYGRASIWEAKGTPSAAITDFQKYLDLGGGSRDGFAEEAKQHIRELRQKL
ncbi:MAG TPA: tetratricopeptide repeat protein [Silvibacterium sp.]|nr:tetratricopeptide repeat protein [Silvibacterium sp.]